MKNLFIITCVIIICLTACGGSPSTTARSASDTHSEPRTDRKMKPLFPNSVASNDLDFIMDNDAGACWSMASAGSGTTEMYDPRRDALMVDGALHFDVAYPDQTVRINVHPGVKNPAQRAEQAAVSVSKLPVQMRKSLLRVHILDGDGGAWAEDLGRFFTLYDGLMARRLSEHDLDETVFHETAHVALDPMFEDDPDWQESQQSDGNFVTDYAEDNPNQEDIAETALFAWTMLHHPQRLPQDIENTVNDTVPNRLAYLTTALADYVPPSCSE